MEALWLASDQNPMDSTAPLVQVDLLGHLNQDKHLKSCFTSERKVASGSAVSEVQVVAFEWTQKLTDLHSGYLLGIVELIRLDNEEQNSMPTNVSLKSRDLLFVVE